LSQDNFIGDTDSAIKYCNEKITLIDGLLADSTELSDKIKLLQAQTYWVERLDSMLRLADKQGKGVTQLSDIVPKTRANKVPKIPKNIHIEPESSES
jgi:hypothetical protein